VTVERTVNASLSTITESVASEPRQVSSTDQPSNDLTIVSILPTKSTEPWLSGLLCFLPFWHYLDHCSCHSYCHCLCYYYYWQLLIPVW